MFDKSVTRAPGELERHTLAEAIRSHALARPLAPAVVFPDRAVLTYGALLQQIEQIGTELRRAGVGIRSRVAVLLPDGPELAIAIAATACYATVVPLNPNLTAAETNGLFDTHRIDALVTLDDADLPARQVAERCGVSLLVASHRDDDLGLTLRASSRIRPPADLAVGADDTALILRTSGTTGLPKLVAVTHGNLFAMAMRLRDWFDLEPSDRVLCLMPLHYAQGLKNALFVPLILGSSVACPPRSSNSDFFNWLAELEPTWYSGGPTLHRSVLDRALALKQTKLSHSLRFIHSAAAPLPDTIRDGLEALFDIPVIDSYGLSEAGLVASGSIALPGRKRGTVGKSRRGELALKTADGKIVEIGGPGEIMVRGPGVTPGYIDDPVANRAAFTDGWFHTGDVGRIDADGFVTIVGRIKELINRGGEKIAPAEIDEALLRHPAVAEASAFAVPHARLGEDIVAAVVIRPGTTATPLELRQFLRTTLAPFKVPRRIQLVARLPKGDTGKIRRYELSRLFGTGSVERPTLQWSSALEIEIAEIWRRLLGRADIEPEDDFFELGGDSLLATQMLVELERFTGSALSEGILFENATIGQLAESLTRKDREPDQSLLTQLQRGTGKAPFIFIDGDFWGGGYYARNIARLLGPDRPFYSLRSHGLLSERIPSIEEMARDYKHVLETAGLHGPYRLGGHCNGALIALELAHQLEAAGRRVELVAMIEPLSLNARPGMRLAARLVEAVHRLLVRDPEEREARIGAAMSRVWHMAQNMDTKLESWKPFPKSIIWWTVREARKFSQVQAATSKVDNGVNTLATKVAKRDRALAAKLVRLIKAYHGRMASYVPAPVAADVLCFVAESHVKSAEFSGEAWRNLAPQCEIATVPGDHLTCITTHAEILVDRLRDSLAALDQAPKHLSESGG